MGRRPRSKPTHEPETIQTWEPEPEPEAIIHPEDQALDEVFSDFPQNENCIELFRTTEQGGRPKFLEQVSPAMFSMAYVTERFGGGKYLARAKYKNGAKVRMPFDIEGDPFPVKRVMPKPDGQPASSPVERIVTRLVEQEPGADGETHQTALLSLMRTLIGEIKNSETAVLEKMKLYKDLFAPARQAETPLDQALNMFQKGVEMGMMGEGGAAPWWMTVLRELKEPLGQIVQTVRTQIERSQQVAPKPPQGTAPASSSLPGQPLIAPDRTGAPPTPSPGTHEAPLEPPSSLNTLEPDQVMMLQLKTILPMLINGAAKNTDPEVYLDFVLDQMPVSGYDALRIWLLKPECLETLAQIEPGIRFQQEWWNGLRSGLLETLNEELGHAVRTLHPDPPSVSPTEPPTDHADVP